MSATRILVLLGLLAPLAGAQTTPRMIVIEPAAPASDIGAAA